MSIDATLAELVDQAVERAFARRDAQPERIALSVPEAAAALGCGPDLIRRLIDQGELPTVPTGSRRLLIPVAALHAYANGEKPAVARLRPA